MQQIERGIYIETAFSGVTLGALAFPHGSLLIDAPLRAEDARAWRSSVNSISINPNRLLINLDAHIDRTLGARAMDTTIVAHLRTAQVFRNRPSVFKGQSSESGAEWEASNDVVGTRWAVPDITFTNSMSFNWGGPEVVLEHHPGPSLGSVWAIIPELKVIFVGDSAPADQPPFLASADLPAWIDSLEELTEKYAEYKIISGRGGLVTVDMVQAQHRLLKSVVKAMDKLAKKSGAPEQTEAMVESLLAELALPVDRQEQYLQRLRHGLYYYYARRYRPIDNANPDQE